jgi:hypothetical protein
LLMEADPELASFPQDGTSPLYLAILLENKIIAKTLYEKSKGILSYSGPNGQNALHAAVLRGEGRYFFRYFSTFRSRFNQLFFSIYTVISIHFASLVFYHFGLGSCFTIMFKIFCKKDVYMSVCSIYFLFLP